MVLGLLDTSGCREGQPAPPFSPPAQAAQIHVQQADSGTLVRVAATRAIPFKEITPIFEDLGINIVSFGTDRQLGNAIQQQQKKHLQAFRGSFLVTDDDGENLGDGLVDALVEALQRVLQVSGSCTIRKSDSISSNLSNASTCGFAEQPIPAGAPKEGGSSAGADARLPASHQLLADSGSQALSAAGSGSLKCAPSGEEGVGAMAPCSSLQAMSSMQGQGSRDVGADADVYMDRVDSGLSSMPVSLLTSRHGSTLGGHSTGSLLHQPHLQRDATQAAAGCGPGGATAMPHVLPLLPGYNHVTGSVSRQHSSSSSVFASSGQEEAGPQVASPRDAAAGDRLAEAAQQRAPAPPQPISLVPPPPMAHGEGAGGVAVERAASLTRQLSLREDDLLELAAGHQTVDSIMNSPVRHVHMHADLVTAKALMSQHQISALLVDTGTPSPGFITKRDFLKVSFSKTLKHARVKDVMTQPAICIHSGASLREAVQMIALKGVRRILVYDASRESPTNFMAPYVGLVSDTDIFRVLGTARGSTANRPEAQANTQPASQRQQQQENAVLTSPGHDGLRASGQLQLQPHQSAGSSMSIGSLAMSMSSISEQAKHFSTEERYRAAAALWELDFNELEVLRRIGEGSFGEVMLANFRGTKVAVKRMRGFELPNSDDGPGPSPTMMPVFAQFFEREIEIMATIRHPNVVTFIGACHTPPNVCLVTEYCARGSLDHLLHKSGLHLDLTKKIEFGMDIVRGMSCLHAQRPAIIHRDLKTANLLVSARFEVKVSDFGLSRIKDHAQLINSRAGLEGTVEYCAPEVLRGEPYTEKCDVWSFGVVMWELVNRQRPYADTDVPIYILMMSLGTGSLRLPSLREEASTPGLVRLVERCFAWQPADRPSFREVLHALENEYKVVRGKAAAVPRSDSASSMVVLGAHPQHGESVDPQQHLHPNNCCYSPHAAARPPSAAASHLPAPVAHALGAGSSSRGGGVPSGMRGAVPLPAAGRQPRNPGRSGDGSSGGDAPITERHSSHAPSRFAPSHSGSGMPQQGEGSTGGDVLRTRNSGGNFGAAGGSRSNASQAGAGPGLVPSGSAGKQGRPPRPRRLSRARSTPLPEHFWFQDPHAAVGEDEDESEGSDGQGVGQGGMAPAHLSMAGSSEGPPRASKLIPIMSPTPFPLSRLTNIPEMGSLHEGHGAGYESGSTISTMSSPRVANNTPLVPDKPASSLGGWATGPASEGVGASSEGLASGAAHASSADSMGSTPTHSTPTAAAAAGACGSPPHGPPPVQVHTWSSPFDGFLPFGDEPDSPDTPRMRSKAGVSAAATAGSDVPQPESLDKEGLQLPAAVHSVPRIAQMSSPFSAYSQLEPQVDGAGDEAGDAGSCSTASHAPSASPAAAGAAPPPAATSAGSGAKTGNFFSPFAALASFDDAAPADAAQTHGEGEPQQQHAQPGSHADAPQIQTPLAPAPAAPTGAAPVVPVGAAVQEEGEAEPSSAVLVTISGHIQPAQPGGSAACASRSGAEQLPATSPLYDGGDGPQSFISVTTSSTSSSAVAAAAAAALLASRGGSGVLTHSTHSEASAPLHLDTSMSMCLSMDSPAVQPPPDGADAMLTPASSPIDVPLPSHAHPLQQPHASLLGSSVGLSGRPVRSSLGGAMDGAGLVLRVSPVAAGKMAAAHMHGEAAGLLARPGSPAAGPGSAPGRRSAELPRQQQSPVHAGGGGREDTQEGVSGSSPTAGDAAAPASSSLAADADGQLTVHQVAWVKV